MDIETSEAIDGVRGDLRHVEAVLSGRIDALESRVGDGFDALAVKFDALDAKIDRVESTLRVEMTQMRDDIRRHFDIIAESLRDDIRIIAESLISLNAKVERLRPSNS